VSRLDATGDGNGRDVRAVFFDAGFTLIFPSRPVLDLYLDTARAVSSAHCETALREAFRRAWAGGTRDPREDHRSSDAIERERWHRFTRGIAEQVPALLPHHDAWLSRLTQEFDAATGWALAPDARSVLARLRARGLRVGIVSNWHSGLHRILVEMKLLELVDFVVCSADVGFRKPHPAIFHAALEQGGASPSATVHVGDTWSEDVVGAHGVGIRALHLAKNATAPADGAAHLTIESLTEVEKLV
jgi:putative hydrolase of the HAD superfamily